MQEALAVFVNGLTGVFTGMAVLYITIKLISLLAGQDDDTGKKP